MQTRKSLHEFEQDSNARKAAKASEASSAAAIELCHDPVTNAFARFSPAVVHRQLRLDFELSGDRKADIEAVTGQCNAALEAIIRQYPEQWLWSNRRFRHSPDLVGDGYTDRVKKHAVG